MTESLTPAGWYAPDPTKPGELRYWDGSHWTDRVHTQVVGATTVERADSRSAHRRDRKAKRREKWRRRAHRRNVRRTWRSNASGYLIFLVMFAIAFAFVGYRISGESGAWLGVGLAAVLYVVAVFKS